MLGMPPLFVETSAHLLQGPPSHFADLEQSPFRSTAGLPSERQGDQLALPLDVPHVGGNHVLVLPLRLLDLKVWQRPVEYAQFTGIACDNRCKEMGVRPSMGSVRDAYHNAMAKSFFASLACKLIARRSWKTFTEARLAAFAWIESWNNPRRRHSGLGYLSPMNFGRK